MSAALTLADHLLALGSGADFAVWPVMVLRGAGVPFAPLAALADEALAARIDAGLAAPELEQHYETAATAAAGRLRTAIADERYLRALIWQNPGVARTWLLEHARGDGPIRRNARQRKRESVALSYLQRYAAKNDTVGFFGPVGWARWGPGGGLRARYGDGLLADQTVHFECWALDQLAVAWSERPDVAPLVAYRRVPAVGVDGSTAWRGTGSPVELTGLETLLLELIDGGRTAADLAAPGARARGPGGAGAGGAGAGGAGAGGAGAGGAGAGGGAASAEDVVAALADLRRRGLVRRDLRVPLSSWPEIALAERLGRLPGEGPAAAAAELAALVRLRDAVAGAAGPDELLERIEAVHARFEELSGQRADRLAGTHFVGRTPLYTDSRRDAEVTVGRAVLDEVAPALEGVLLAARWFSSRVGAGAMEAARRSYDQLAAAGAEVRFPQLLFALNPVVLRDTEGVIARAQKELLERFARVIAPATPTAGTVRLDPVEFRDRSLAAFGRPDPAFAVGRYHSPDLMIDAPDADAVAAGDYRVVLGELHAGMNTLQSRALVTHCPFAEELQGYAERDPVPERVVPLFPKGWPRVNSRTYPPPLLVSSRRQHVAIGGDLGVEDVPAVPAGDLLVRERGGALVASTRDGGWQRPLAEVMGEFLSMASATRFGLVGDGPAWPRVEAGRLVVTRRTWRYAPPLPFVGPDHAARRFAAVRAWVRAEGLPRHVFVRIPGEPKPWYVDFASPLLVENLVRLLRRLRERGGGEHGAGESVTGEPGGGESVTVTEMLPGPDGLWLSDAEGRRYTSELRLVAVDLRQSQTGGGAATA